MDSAAFALEMATPLVLCAFGAFGGTLVLKKLLIDLYVDRDGGKRPWFYDSSVAASHLVLGCLCGAILNLTGEGILIGLAGGVLAEGVVRRVRKRLAQ